MQKPWSLFRCNRYLAAGANAAAAQALQDIYDLAYLAQTTQKTVPSAHDAGAAAAPAKKAPDAPVAQSQPPFHQKVPPLLPLATDPSLDDACPYPDAAISKGETGTVVLLVYVSGDGAPLDVAVEQTSGSALLDDFTAQCVKKNARFAAKHAAGRPVNYWGRMRFSWTFGQ